MCGKKILLIPDPLLGICIDRLLILKDLLAHNYKSIEVEIAKIQGNLYDSEDYIEEKSKKFQPDLTVSFGLGNLLIGLLSDYNRLMINPDFFFSNKELVMKDLDESLLTYKDISKFSGEVWQLESPSHNIKGKKYIHFLFDGNFDDKENMDECYKRFGRYEVIENLDLYSPSGIENIASEIIRNLKISNHPFLIK